MHDIKLIRENPQAFDEGLRRRGLSPRAQELIALDEKRRAAILALQNAQERRNAISKQIGVAMGRQDAVAAEDYRADESPMTRRRFARSFTPVANLSVASTTERSVIASASCL